MESENKKILLVEDDPNFGTVLKDYLSMNGYDVTHAKNGMEGFEKFKKDDFVLGESSLISFAESEVGDFRARYSLGLSD